MAETPLPEYELYAIRYATRDARRTEHFLGGDPRDEPMAMDYFLWAAIGPERTIVIDTGFSAAVAARRRRTYLGDPGALLARLGVDPAAVRDVVLTHLHYDHAGNVALFPAARFHVQDAEVHFVTGRDMRHRHFTVGYEVDDIAGVVRLNFARRLTIHDGAVDLAPGVRLEPAPGHTPGQQVVRVHTRRGWVTVASDVAHFYENLLRRRPFPAVVDVRQALDSYERILALAPDPEHVVPGHDPLVMQAYPAPRPELEGLVVRLDVPPKEVPALGDRRDARGR